MTLHVYRFVGYADSSRKKLDTFVLMATRIECVRPENTNAARNQSSSFSA